ELKEEINQKLKELIRIEPFRFDAIPASGFLGDITSLKSLLWDLDKRVRAAAVEALAKLEDKVPEEVIKDIAGLLRDDNRYVRAAAVETLSKLGDRVPEEVIKDIAARLRDDNGYVRETAVEVLAKLEE
ncbi:HEAT repeat domain-containing protein, partial [Methanophagales archaeon]